ncbi:MAG: hypothetical protein MUC49_12485 [Raineya sp.]|jgi:uncharacterized protein YodC (DUF2158 family)|nr:hypothetical protein [Raineya sp.]
MVICGYVTRGRKNYYYLGKVNCRWLDRNGHQRKDTFHEDELDLVD